MNLRTFYTLSGLAMPAAWIAMELTTGTTLVWVTGCAAVLFLFSGLVFVIATLASLVRLTLPPLAGLLGGLAGIAMCLFAYFPGGEGVLERLTTPDGTEVVLVQQRSGEPYTVDFFFRKPGKPWGWFYYEHEETRWNPWTRHLHLSPDGRTVLIHRLFSPVATFEPAAEKFTIHRQQRATTNVAWMPASWTPGLSRY